jgi:hypothetical protein
MTEQVIESPVRYRFTPLSQGMQLEIWELALSQVKSDKPFLFRVKYLLPNRQEAEYALEDYLRNNGLSFADDASDLSTDAAPRRLLSNRKTHS